MIRNPGEEDSTSAAVLASYPTMWEGLESEYGEWNECVWIWIQVIRLGSLTSRLMLLPRMDSIRSGTTAEVVAHAVLKGRKFPSLCILSALLLQMALPSTKKR